jgi:formamidopyrimidine-DNA glycosylase
MGKFNRKIKRQQKKDAEKELKTKIGLFGQLDDHCLVCEKEFDKKNVKEKVVRLYCPDCWTRANKLIEDIKNGHKNTESDV